MKERILAWFVTRLLKLLALLSYANTQKLGRFIGRILWMGDSSVTRVTKVNIELAYPDYSVEDQQRLIKASLTETAKLFAEFGAMWEWPSDKALSLIQSVQGRELFDEASKQNKGLIVLAPHHGNWELVGLYLSTLRPMAALYRPPKIKPLEDYMSKVRGRHGSELVPTTKRGVVRLFSVLREQGMVGILPDQVPGGTGGVFAPFMGVESNTIKLVSRLIEKTDCLVVSAVAMRRDDDTGFDLIFREAEPEIYSKDLMTSVVAMNQMVERCVMDRPEQYQWEYKRFKDARKGSRHTYGP